MLSKSVTQARRRGFRIEQTQQNKQARIVEDALIERLSKLVSTIRIDASDNKLTMPTLQRKYDNIVNELLHSAIQQVYIIGSEYAAHSYNVNGFLTPDDLVHINDLVNEFTNSFWIRFNKYILARGGPTATTFNPKSPLSDKYVVTSIATISVTKTLSLSTIYKIKQLQRRDSSAAMMSHGQTIRLMSAQLSGSAMLEWKTAMDDRVCPICDALEGQQYEVDDPSIPVPGTDDTHPNCRCRLMLVGADGEEDPETSIGEDESLDDLLLPTSLALGAGAAAGAAIAEDLLSQPEEQQCDDGYHWDEDSQQCVSDDDNVTPQPQ